MKPCTVGHGNSKSSLELKTVCYSPRKQPENAKTTSFDLAGDFKSSSELKTVFYSPQKQPEIVKTMSFDVAEETVYRWSQVLKIVFGSKQCAIAHENGQKTRKRRV